MGLAEECLGCGKILALLHGWHLCIDIVCLANVPKCALAVRFYVSAEQRTVANRVTYNVQYKIPYCF